MQNGLIRLVHLYVKTSALCILILPFRAAFARMRFARFESKVDSPTGVNTP